MSSKTAAPLWLILGGIALMWGTIDSLSPAGVAPALLAGACALALAGFGWLCLALAWRGWAADDLMLVAPAAGLILGGALAQVAANLGIWLTAVFWVIAGLGAVGVILGARRLYPRLGAPVPYGWVILALAVLIGVAYFTPVSVRDGVALPDGGMQWLSSDDILHEAMVTQIRAQAFAPPRVPSYGQEVIVYHYGRHALAATVAQATAASSADALFRVIYPLGELALIAAAFAFGRWSTPRGAEPTLGGVIAVAAVFFVTAPHKVLGWLLVGSVGIVPGVSWLLARMANLPGVDYSVHLIAGSALWGGIVLLAVLGLSQKMAHAGEESQGRRLLVVLLAGAAICLNLMAGGLAALGVSAVWLWGDRRNRRVSLWPVLPMLAVGIVFIASGLAGAGEQSGQAVSLPQNLPAERYVNVFLILTLAWVTRAPAWLQLASGVWATRVLLIVLTPAAFSIYLFVRLWNAPDEIYALLFLSILLSGWVAGPMALLFSDGAAQSGNRKRVRVLADRLAWFVLALGVTAFAVAWVLVVNYVMALLVAALMIPAALWLAARRARRTSWLRAPALALATVVVVLGLTGWVPTVISYGWNGTGTTVLADPGRVRSLTALSTVAPQSALVATAHHRFPGYEGFHGESVLYAALSGRRMLVESTLYYYADLAPNSVTTLRDNDLLFTTNDAGAAHAIVHKYSLDYIVTEPGATLAFAAQANWLEKIPNDGTLGLWRVRR